MRWPSIALTLMIGLWSCVRDMDVPASYGVGENRGPSGMAFGSQTVGFYTVLDVQDVEASETVTDTAGKEVSKDTTVELREDTVTCVGTERYCTCMTQYKRTDYCECVDSPQGNQTLFCECTIMVCVATPDSDMAGQYLAFCKSMHPAQCGSF